MTQPFNDQDPVSLAKAIRTGQREKTAGQAKRKNKIKASDPNDETGARNRKGKYTGSPFLRLLDFI